MEHLKMHTVDKVDANIERIEELFPNAIEIISEDGVLRKVVDFDILKQELSRSVLGDKQDRYQFTWPDKNKTVVLSNSPISKTLRLQKDKCVGKDGTPGGLDSENIYIEGDNLDALKILQQTYLGKIKVIYIDPPYNTGNDFIYNDSFKQSSDDYADNSGQTDDEGNILVQNTEVNGRFHTDWLNMMYSRLRIAKSFLADDGVIFISVDDHEQANLKKICDEVFGEANFIDNIIWEKRYSPQNAVQWFSENHDYVIVYAKNKLIWRPQLLERTEEMNGRYKNIDNDPRGPWKAGDSTAQAGHGTKNQFYTLVSPNGTKHELPSGLCWRYTQEAMNKLIAENRVWFGTDGNNVPAIKKFLSEVKQGVACQTIWKYSEVGHTQEGKKEVKALFPEGTPFDTPKPVRLIEKILKVAAPDSEDCYVMDFFSGSSTTAHAVMKLNASDNGHRKYIMVQVKEPCDENSEAYRIGMNNICDIGEERIRRSSEQIRNEFEGTVFDGGFRCYAVDSSNMKDVYYSPAEYTQGQMEMYKDNIKPDRTPEDLLIQVMLDLGVLLSSKIEETIIAEKKVFSVADGYLIACFDDVVTDDVVKAIAEKHPFYAVFRDSGMASDSVAANFEQIFETYSPNTIRKVL